MTETILSKSYPRDRMLITYLIFPFALQVLLIMLMVNYTNITNIYILNALITLMVTFIYVFQFNKPQYLLYHLILMIVLQNFIIGIGNTFTNNQTSGQNLKLALVYKELLAAIIVLMLLIKFYNRIKLFRFEKVVFWIFILIALSFLISDANFDAKIYYTRTFLIIFIAYAIGRLLYYGLKNKTQELEKIFIFVSQTGVIVAIIGFLFMLIDTKSHIWNDWFNWGLVQEAKRGEYQEFPYSQTQLGSLILPRMFSIFFDAISLGYFLATALFCTWLRKGKKTFLQLILIAALICTFVKGAIGLVVITSIWIIGLRFMKINRKLFIVSIVLSIILAFLFLLNSDFKSSSDVHFAGLIEPIINSVNSPFGTGLGNGGNYYSIKQNIPAWFLSHTGAESFFGVLIYQLGFPGVILYLVFFIGAIKTLLQYGFEYKDQQRNVLITISGVMFAILIASLFQESTLGINFTGILMILIGLFFSSLQVGSTELTRQTSP